MRALRTRCKVRIASHTRPKGTPSRGALPASSVPTSEKATMSIPLSTMRRASASSIRRPAVVVDTRHPALRAKATKSIKRGCRKGSPQPCRWTRPLSRMSGQSRAKVSASMCRDRHTDACVVCGQ